MRCDLLRFYEQRRSFISPPLRTPPVAVSGGKRASPYRDPHGTRGPSPPRQSVSFVTSLAVSHETPRETNHGGERNGSKKRSTGGRAPPTTTPTQLSLARSIYPRRPADTKKNRPTLSPLTDPSSIFPEDVSEVRLRTCSPSARTPGPTMDDARQFSPNTPFALSACSQAPRALRMPKANAKVLRNGQLTAASRGPTAN